MKLLLGLLTLITLFLSPALFAQGLTDKQTQEAYEAGIFEARATTSLQIKLHTDYLTPCEIKSYTNYGVQPLLLGKAVSAYQEIKTSAFNEVMRQRIQDSLPHQVDSVGVMNENMLHFDSEDYSNFFQAFEQTIISDSLVELKLPENTLEKLGYTYLEGLIIKHLETNKSYSLSDIKQGIRLPYVKNSPLTFVTDPRNINNTQLCIDMIYYPLKIKA
ncbi:hypothetical protein SAMN05216474_0618 [Lishizhenia tianjinensis]|uniref:DUF4919 domain-containing protein n=1 Tax=Lishizhenia tianjinensis TaxID=477690 RepID=A0A1I6Y3A7_9FLAO|nr:hypothetical protein [Lishizhenia tianjinensis]SFT44711.1 hypothetical protein SAMN05216474_0618 [Lishizhenia tianjinensis]